MASRPHPSIRSLRLKQGDGLRRRCPGSSGLLRVVPGIMVIASLWAGGSLSRADDALGTIRLQLEKVGEEEVKADPSPRLAVLLVDCSASMTNTTEAEGRGKERSEEVLKGLREWLVTLAQESPDIVVRIRFFATKLDCWEQVSGRLKDVASVDAIMARIPGAFPIRGDGGGTSLYESTCKVIDESLDEHRTRHFGWMLFAVFSDGKDQNSGATYDKNAYTRKILEFEKAGQDVGSEFATAIVTVGPDAKKAAAAKDYGPVTTQNVGDRIPKPPAPRPRYALVPAADQSTDLSFKRLAQHGKASLSVAVTGAQGVPAGVVEALSTRFSLKDGAYRLETAEGGGFAAGPSSVVLDLPAEVDVAKGVAATLTVEPLVAADQSFLLEGKPSFTFTFLGTKTLPPAQWKSIIQSSVKRGLPARCTVNPGDISDPMWTFIGPAGQSVEVPGLAVEPTLPAAGPWKATFRGTADTGDPVSGELGTVNVIDADFAFEPAAVAVKAGEIASLRIVPVAGASEATYSISIDGESLAASIPEISIPADRLDTVGRHVVRVTATVGDFDWTHDAMVDVLVATRIEIRPKNYNYREGTEQAVVNVDVSGELGDAIFVQVDDREPIRVPVFREAQKGKEKIAQIPVSIPVGSIGRAFDIVVSPEREGACKPYVGHIEGRAADVRCDLVSPLDGSPVSVSEPPGIVVEPAGDDTGKVGDVEYAIGFRPAGSDAPIPDGPRANRSAKWTVALPPDLDPGPLDIFARPVGGRLRPEVFPEGKEWRKIGTLHVMPTIPWIAVVGADPASLRPSANGESAPIGPVHPGKPVELQLRDVPKDGIEEIRWSFGQLAGDPQFEEPKDRPGANQKLLNFAFTPMAVGILPIDVTFRMASGVAIAPARATLEVEARPIIPTPRIGDAKLQATAKSESPRPAPPHRASGDIVFHPGIDGDFLDATVGVYEKGAAADAKPIWSQTFPQGTETVVIPSAALPAVPWGKRYKDIELRLSIRPYPGYDLPLPALTPIPHSLPEPKHWVPFLASMLLLVPLAWGIRRCLFNHIGQGSLVFAAEKLPTPGKEVDVPANACELELAIDGSSRDGSGEKAQMGTFTPWSVQHKHASITLGHMAEMLIAKNPTSAMPQPQWILAADRPVAGHRIYIRGPWFAPFSHASSTRGLTDGLGTQLSFLNIECSKTADSTREPPSGANSAACSETYKISDTKTKSNPPLYFRVMWRQYHDPFLWHACGLALLAVLLLIASAFVCNIVSLV